MQFENFEQEKRVREEPKHKAIPIISTTVEILTLCGLAGILTLVQFNFTFADVVWSIFGLFLALRLTMIFLAKDASARTRIEKGQEEQEHKELVKFFKDSIKEVNTADFDSYINTIENPRRKKEAYRAKINPKIEKLCGKIEKWTLAKKICEKKEKRFWVKIYATKIEKAEIKLSALKEKISDKYLDNNIDIIKVKYAKVKVNQFFVLDLIGEVDKEQLTLNLNYENKKGIVKSLPISAAFIILITLIGLDDITFGSINFVSLLLDLLSIAWNLASGWFSIGSKTLAKQQKIIANKIAFVEHYKKEKAVD